MRRLCLGDLTVLPGSISLAWFHLSPRILRHLRLTLKNEQLIHTNHKGGEREWEREIVQPSIDVHFKQLDIETSVLNINTSESSCR